MRRRKYSNVKVECDGHMFDSKRERDRYLELKLLERGHEIRNLELQPKFPLTCGGVPVCIGADENNSGRQSSIVLDFEYEEKRGSQYYPVLEDVKGFDTPISRLKRAVFLAETGRHVRIIK